MNKSIKLNNDIYLDSSGVTHNKTLLKDILTFSEEEQVIDTLEDGTLLCRRLVKFTTSTNTEWKGIATIPNVKYILNISGSVNKPSTKEIYPLYYMDDIQLVSYFDTNSNSLKIKCFSYIKGLSGIILILYIRTNG